MSSSASRRILRSAAAEEEVFVVGGPMRRDIPADGPVATVLNLISGAHRRGEQITTDAEDDAAVIIAHARAEAAAVREQAHAEGFEAGFQAAQAEAAAQLAVIRAAAADGLAVREGMIDEAMPAIARAVAMATRRIVGAAYEAEPSLTNDCCADAVRNAAGQQIISIRVNSAALDEVRASLVDVANYVQPDSAVAIGGCIVDVENGTIDATLDTRLDLLDAALRAAGGSA
jgi:flagellar biosynthesis/type III secretory pathway protein FliH